MPRSAAVQITVVDDELLHLRGCIVVDMTRTPQDTEAQWLAKHKGRLVNTTAYVWDCGDDYCGCSQAVIVEQYENKVLGLPWIVPVYIWEGPYHTDFEPGAQSELDAEVARRGGVTDAN